MSGWLDGDVAYVTGGAGGIGLAVAARYLEEGARGVVVLDLNLEGLAPLQAAHPSRVAGVQGDVREYASHEKAVRTALERFGALDVLVANAGVFDFRRPLRGYTPELMTSTMDELFAVNLRGYLFAAMAAREALMARKGSVIFTTSVAGTYAGGGGVLYTMAKAAIGGLVRQLALEFAPDVRVNGVAPGGTLTRLSGTQALGHGDRTIGPDPDEMRKRIEDATPLRLAQAPEDHAGVYVLLASRRNSRAMTGQIIMSDGGIAARSL